MITAIRGCAGVSPPQANRAGEQADHEAVAARALTVKPAASRWEEPAFGNGNRR